MKQIAPLVAAALLLSAGAARASVEQQQDPSKGPRTEGPVTLDDSTCDERTIRSDDGTVLGSGNVCIYLYSFDTTSEIDLTREYGAAWAQARFTPAQGWCATEVESRIELSEGDLERIAKGPARPGKVTTRLPMDARGNAIEEALISKAWTSSAGKTSNTAPAGKKPSTTSAWKGKSAKPVSLVGGLAYSYDILEGSPEKVGYGFSKLSVASC